MSSSQEKTLQVQIDSNGDSEGNYVLLAMVNDEDSDNYCNETGTSVVAVGSFEYDKEHVPVGNIV